MLNATTNMDDAVSLRTGTAFRNIMFMSCPEGEAPDWVTKKGGKPGDKKWGPHCAVSMPFEWLEKACDQLEVLRSHRRRMVGAMWPSAGLAVVFLECKKELARNVCRPQCEN